MFQSLIEQRPTHYRKFQYPQPLASPVEIVEFPQLLAIEERTLDPLAALFVLTREISGVLNGVEVLVDLH